MCVLGRKRRCVEEESAGKSEREDSAVCVGVWQACSKKVAPPPPPSESKRQKARKKRKGKWQAKQRVWEVLKPVQSDEGVFKNFSSEEKCFELHEG